MGLSLLAIVYRSARLDIDVMGKIDGEKAAWGNVERHPERRAAMGHLTKLEAFWITARGFRERRGIPARGVPPPTG